MTPARIVGWLLVAALAAGVGWVVWQRMKPKPLQVMVAKVERGNVLQLVANTRAGTVKACRQADLSPGVGGQIATLPVKKGDQVKEGDLLIEVWNKDLSSQLTLATSEGRAAAARARALLRQSELSLREAGRMKKLRATAAISVETLDQANTRAVIDQAQYAAALAEEQVIRDRLNLLAVEMERTRLLAPFAGIVAEVNGELSEYVTPSPPGIPTPPTVILLDTSCFYVSAPIDEVDAAAITVGMPTTITLDAFAARHFAGQVRRIDPYVLDREKQARTVEVEVSFVTLSDTVNLLSGYSADVEIVVDSRDKVLSIPTQAVLDGGRRVLVFDAQSARVHDRAIAVGLGNWQVTEVVSGLSEGEKVVLSTDRPGLKDNVRAEIEASP
ncbi:MAG: efflux RND transporter periplasmic adaptor subunit [Proteobacteria bacterium]|nr:efflux RND transporter periplasmic adaptor subunit [Desulfobulbaceae bacterium]MBU4152622.1 efflux RND transporter periplasmic adaptor subunit [Pseudomonadota bacterium]